MSRVQMHWLDWPETAQLVAALSGDRMRFVGGAVRDALLGRASDDIDVATPLAPDEVMARAAEAGMKAIPTGIAHGTVTLVAGGRKFEVTTLRRDVETDGRHAVVAFTDDWRADAARRDFTLNALYASPSGELFDYFGGREDLLARRVRFIGDAVTRIREDGLRILRFFRFTAHYAGGVADAQGRAACASRARDLMALSRERICTELLKLLAADDCAACVEAMQQDGIFAAFLPEVQVTGSFARLVQLELALGDVAPLRRLAMLLPNDPAVREGVAMRLRLSAAQRKRLAGSAGAAPEDEAALAALIYREGREGALDRLLLALPALDRVQPLWRWAMAWPVPRLPRSGRHLIAAGVEEGPWVSAALQRFETAWVAAGFPQDEPALDLLVKQVTQNG